MLYPAFYSLHLATLNKSMTRFIGLGNYIRLLYDVEDAAKQQIAQEQLDLDATDASVAAAARMREAA